MSNLALSRLAVTLLAVAVAATACSPGRSGGAGAPSGTSTGAGPGTGSASAGAQTAGAAGGPADTPAGTPCDRKLLTVQDVAGIMKGDTVRSENVPGDVESCKFTTGDASGITFSFRAKNGRASLGIWRDGKMPVSSAPLPAVGSQAVWVDDLNEVDAEQDDHLCSIGVQGIRAATSRDQLKQRLGALCNKAVAAAAAGR